MTPSAAELVARYGDPDEFALDGAEAGCPSNSERADWALAALRVFNAYTMGDPYPTVDAKVIDEVGGDFICYLLHAATRAGTDPDELLDRARRHFVEEVGLGYDDEELTPGGQLDTVAGMGRVVEVHDLTADGWGVIVVQVGGARIAELPVNPDLCPYEDQIAAARHIAGQARARESALGRQ